MNGAICRASCPQCSEAGTFGSACTRCGSQIG